MKLTQHKTKWLARLMLGLVLFAQGVVAASACVAPAASPAQAYFTVQQDNEAIPCHEEEISNANACLSHCTQPDQISGDHHGVPFAAPVSLVVWVSNQPQEQHIRQAISSEHLVLDTGPPIPIRFCSLLN